MAEDEMRVALTDERVEQSVLLPSFKELCALKCDRKAAEEFANLGQCVRDEFKRAAKHGQFINGDDVRHALRAGCVVDRKQHFHEPEVGEEFNVFIPQHSRARFTMTMARS